MPMGSFFMLFLLIKGFGLIIVLNMGYVNGKVIFNYQQTDLSKYCP